MRIGLLSDTHSYLDPKVFKYFEECDEIWHAGDIGSMDVVDQLEAFRPLRAVFGNIDDKDMRLRFPEDDRFECEGSGCLDDSYWGISGTLQHPGERRYPEKPTKIVYLRAFAYSESDA